MHIVHYSNYEVFILFFEVLLWSELIISIKIGRDSFDSKILIMQIH